MHDKDAQVHEQMGNQRTHDHPVRLQEKVHLKAVPAHDRRITRHQSQKRQISPQTGDCLLEPVPGKIEIQEPASCQQEKILNQRIIVVILIDHLDIDQNQNNIKRA